MAENPSRLMWWGTRVVVPLLVLGVGGGAAALVSLLSPAVDVVPPQTIPIPVEAITVGPMTSPAMVYASGVVRPSQEVTILPEVSGRVVEMSPQMVPGGRLHKGEVMARIDARDYRLALDTEESRVSQAELDLALEEGRGRAAEREWTLLGDGRTAEEATLALRGPHLTARKQALQAARSARDRAGLALERTTLRAPFDALVLKEGIDIGQVVGPNAPIATLVGTARFWVEVSIPTSKLSAVQLPSDGTPGSPAVVQWETGNEDVSRTGEVVGLTGSIADDTRRATLLVSVDDPLGPGGLPLLPGAWVDVTIAGKPVDDVVPLPRPTVYSGDRIWVSDVENNLQVRLIEVVWLDPDTVYARGGLQPGDRLITSGLSMPIEGAPVEVIESVGAATAPSTDSDDL